jgi:hypothetical protein
VNKHGKGDGDGVLVNSTYRTVIVRNRANFSHVILLPMHVRTLNQAKAANTFNNTNDITSQPTED